MSDKAVCELCGEPMPPGEEMFKYHGYSGPCPKPPLPQRKDAAMQWQPLDTAPKDGTRILLVKIVGHPGHDTALWWASMGCWSEKWQKWWDGIEPSGLAGPTHWMPVNGYGIALPEWTDRLLDSEQAAAEAVAALRAADETVEALRDEMANYDNDMLRKFDPSAAESTDLYTWITCKLAENERLREALQWIHDACGDHNSCLCGRPTGVGALKGHARTALGNVREEKS